MALIQQQETSSRFNKYHYLVLTLVITSILYLAANNLESEFMPGFPDILQYILYFGSILFMIYASLIATMKAKKYRSNDFRISLILAIGLFFDFIAEATWSIYEEVLDLDPSPSIADLFYIASYAFLAVFLLKFLKMYRNKISIKLISFATILSISLLVPTITATFDWNYEEEINLGLVVAMIYPILDTIIFGISIVGLMFTFSKKHTYFWGLIFIGIIIWVFADTAYLFMEIEEIYYDGHPLDIAWMSPFILIGFALLYQQKIYSKQSKESLFGKENKHSSVQFAAIDKLAIPLSLVIIISLTIFVMFTMNLFEFSESQVVLNAIEINMLIFGIIGIFSGIVFIVHKNLNKLVTIREKEIEEKNTELIQMERLSAIGELSSRLTHDLRNPLSIISTSIENLRLVYGKSKETEGSFLRIGRAMDRMTHQIDDVLDFVKNIPPKMENYSINQILKSVLDTIKIPDTIKINMSSKNISINCDDKQCEIVFYNLIQNSIQAIGKENGEIVIRVIEQNEVVLVEFVDTGPGIPEENLEKIFNPLFTTKQSGTGLGLASCKNLVEGMGGKITVSNYPTIFTVRLPKKNINC